MVVRLRKRMENMQDFMEFESCLRRLYNTTSGVYCQALLTTAYLKWSKELRSHLHLKLDCDVYEELWSNNIDNHCKNNDKILIETMTGSSEFRESKSERPYVSPSFNLANAENPWKLKVQSACAPPSAFSPWQCGAPSACSPWQCRAPSAYRVQCHFTQITHALTHGLKLFPRQQDWRL